jgi:hypothetical protein
MAIGNFCVQTTWANGPIVFLNGCEKDKKLARWADNELSRIEKSRESQPTQGGALGWITGWAFGPYFHS